MKDLGLVVYKETDSEAMAKTLGFVPDPKGYLQDPATNKTLRCDGCGNPIRKDQLGAALHGSRLHYCEDVGCLGHFVASKLRGDRKGKRIPFDLSRHPQPS